MIYRRGELSSQELATIVLGVVGFIIVGYLAWFLFSGTDTLTNQELCHLSIVERASLPALAGNTVPLQCTTDKICISLEEGFFSGFTGAAVEGSETACQQFIGEKNVQVVEIKINDNLNDQRDAVETIERLQANAMYDCWRMTGQGELDVFRGTGDGSTGGIIDDTLDFLDADVRVQIQRPKCLVCSRVAIAQEVYDADAKLERSVLDQVNVKEYLANERPFNSELTYLETFTSEGVRSYGGTDGFDTSEDSLSSESLPADQIAFIFMQIKTELDPSEAGYQSAALAGVAVGGSGLTTGLGRTVTKTVIKKAPILSLVAAVGAVGLAYWKGKDVAEESQAISFAACNSYEEENPNLGCSLIKPVQWDADLINYMCSGGIEGNL